MEFISNEWMNNYPCFMHILMDWNQFDMRVCLWNTSWYRLLLNLAEYWKPFPVNLVATHFVNGKVEPTVEVSCKEGNFLLCSISIQSLTICIIHICVCLSADQVKGHYDFRKKLSQNSRILMQIFKKLRKVCCSITLYTTPEHSLLYFHI